MISRETIGDTHCVVVDLGEHARNQTDLRPISTKMWLDQENGFPPQQIVAKSLPDGTIGIDSLANRNYFFRLAIHSRNSSTASWSGIDVPNCGIWPLPGPRRLMRVNSVERSG